MMCAMCNVHGAQSKTLLTTTNLMEDYHDQVPIDSTGSNTGTTPTGGKFASAWATSEDHNSVGTEYEVPIQDPDAMNDAAKHSAQTLRRQRNTGASLSGASSSSQNPKQSGNRSWGSSRRPLSTNSNDHGSTVTGGAENVWDTTLNTPRTEQSIQERIANTAISGTMELLKQVGGVTVSATGALVAPPLHITRTVLLPNLFAALKDYISSNSPVRLKDWFRIFSTSFYHIFHTLQKTDAGHAFSNRMVVIMIDLIDCLSAETTRQLLLDGMSCFVKFFEIIQTPMFQSYCEQLAVTGCRLIDALSNGRNKLLLFDIQKAVTSAAELLADPATTVALAEVTAHLCYALEMEDQQIQVDEDHKHNATTNGTSPRRHVRDTYQNEAVLKRDTLDNGHSVEEAILSSLGVDNNHNSGDASIPASIILDTEDPKKSTINDLASVSNPGKNPDVSKTLNWHERARHDVDVQLLRGGIWQRAQELKESTATTHQPAMLTTNIPLKTDSNRTDGDETRGVLNKPVSGESELDLEDLDVKERDSAISGDIDNTINTRRAKQSISFQSPNDEHEKDIDKTSPDFALNCSEPDFQSRKDGETANEHFYRILDEILGDARRKSADKIIAEQMAHPSGITAGISRRLRQPESGNSTIKDRLNAIRLDLKANGTNGTTTRKNASTKLDGTDKKVLIVVAIVTLFIISFWFWMGCYGLYVYVYPPAVVRRPSPQFQSGHSAATTTTTASPHEIVIRVVKEIVHVNQDGKEIGREPWKQRADSDTTQLLEHKVADCVASVF